MRLINSPWTSNVMYVDKLGVVRMRRRRTQAVTVSDGAWCQQFCNILPGIRLGGLHMKQFKQSVKRTRLEMLG
jgi:hypothetical protein